MLLPYEVMIPGLLAAAVFGWIILSWWRGFRRIWLETGLVSIRLRAQGFLVGAAMCAVFAALLLLPRPVPVDSGLVVLQAITGISMLVTGALCVVLVALHTLAVTRGVCVEYGAYIAAMHRIREQSTVGRLLKRLHIRRPGPAGDSAPRSGPPSAERKLLPVLALSLVALTTYLMLTDPTPMPTLMMWIDGRSVTPYGVMFDIGVLLYKSSIWLASVYAYLAFAIRCLPPAGDAASQEGRR